MIELQDLWATRINKFDLDLVPFRTIRIEVWNEDQRKAFEIKLRQVERLAFGDSRSDCDWLYAELTSVECTSSSDSDKKEVHFEIWGSVDIVVNCEDFAILELGERD